MAQESMPQPNFRGNRDLGFMTPDLDAAVAFYSGVLGLPIVKRTDDHIEFDAGEFCLFASKSDDAQSFVPSFSVPNAANARTQFLEAGCTVIRDFEGGTGFWARDPLGFVIDVIQASEPKAE
jgi:catechol 2,3-dioxygenase-like lactoylglutathione lyase family enzyme